MCTRYIVNLSLIFFILNRTIFSKTESSGKYATIFHLIIGSYTIWIHYKVVGSDVTQVAMVTPDQSQRENLGPGEWHLISVSAVNTDLSYYIDGKLIDSAILTAAVDYDQGDHVQVGQFYGGM